MTRLQSQRLQHVHTVGSMPGSRSESRTATSALPAFGGGKTYPPDIPAEREAYVVDFDGKTCLWSNMVFAHNKADFIAQELTILFIP
jgi:hypothetical protein